MENKILQHLKDSIKRDKFPDFNEMNKDELILFIQNHLPTKEMLRDFIRAIYFAVQQSFYDKEGGLDSNTRDFSILEGEVTYDYEKDLYYFKPNKTLNKLLSDSSATSSTRLKEVLSSRFYHLVEYLYILETNPNKNK